MFSETVKFTIFNAFVILVVNLRSEFNFNQFYQSIRDLLCIHTTKVGPFIFMNNASDNEGYEIP